MLIYVDVDGVVANLHKAWIAAYNWDYQDSLKESDIHEWGMEKYVKPECGSKINDYLELPELYDLVDPVRGSKEAVEKLRSMGHRVVFATSATKGCAGRKLQWLVKNGFLSFDELANKSSHPDYIEVHDKGLLLGDVLVDDGPHNVSAFRGFSILFSQPHNENFLYPVRANGWDEVIGIMSDDVVPVGVHPTELQSPHQARAFREIIEDMYATHLRKNFDYSPANILATGNVGLVTRLWDKVARFVNLTGYKVSISAESIAEALFWKISYLMHASGFCVKLTLSKTGLVKEPKNESVEDTLMDMAVYSIIGLLLRRGKWGK